MANQKSLTKVRYSINVGLDLNDAAIKSLDLENYKKNKKLNDYRTEFLQDYSNKQQLRDVDKARHVEGRQEYLRLCDGRLYFFYQIYAYVI
jgi:hypothetical protein